MTSPITSTSDANVIADPPLVSDGIKSIYVNWQGPPVSDDRSCSSSGPVVRSILTGRHESISAIARAEIDNPDSDYAVQFSPMPKGQARLEVARIARPAAALPIPRRSRQLRVRPPDALRTPAVVERKPRRPSISKIIEQAEKATGKAVVSITTPDGTKLDFGSEQPSQGNDLDQWIAKRADKTQRH